jgi:hypothetical protein
MTLFGVPHYALRFREYTPAKHLIYQDVVGIFLKNNMKKRILRFTLIIVQLLFISFSYIPFSGIISSKIEFCYNQVISIYIIYFICLLIIFLTFKFQNLIGRILYLIIFIIILILSIGLKMNVIW